MARATAWTLSASRPSASIILIASAAVASREMSGLSGRPGRVLFVLTAMLSPIVATAPSIHRDVRIAWAASRFAAKSLSYVV